MRIRAAFATALASAGILLAGWQAGSQQLTEARTPTAATALTGNAAVGGSPTSGSTTPGSAGGSSAATTYDGAAVQTRFGTVQVRITVKSGTITDVTALHLTDAERKSVQISSRAAPLLRSEVLQAQSGDVQTISGATVTSDAYLTSLQAALDAAHL